MGLLFKVKKTRVRAGEFRLLRFEYQGADKQFKIELSTDIV